MNSQNSKTVLNFIRTSLFILASMAHVHVKAWDVDFSRRNKELKSMRQPASIVDQPAAKDEGIVGSFFQATGPTQEIVILNTEKGFVPETIRLRSGQPYKIHVVNVNEKEKNTSFILDAFSEHHGTYFGAPKSFNISPKTDGVFSFQCPETAKQGRIIVYTDGDRKPASQ